MSEEQRQALDKRIFGGHEWINAKERGESARKLLQDELKFNEVNVHTNLCKDDIIERLNALKAKADRFETFKKDKENLQITIIWVGYTL